MSLLREKANVLFVADQLQATQSTTQNAYLQQLTYSADTSTANYVLTALDEFGTVAWAPQAGGPDNVEGPSSATNNAACRFDGTTAKLIKDSPNTILTDAGVLSTDSIVLATGLQLAAGAGVGNILQSDASGNATWQAPTSVDGPSSATNNAVCRFDSTTGDLIKNSTATLTDAGVLSTASIELATGLQLIAGAGADNVLESDASGNGTWQVSSHVDGPGSATNNAVCRFDSTTGDLIKDSTATLTDAGVLSTDSIAVATGLQLVAGAATGNILESDGSGNGTWQASSQVAGPGSATNNALCRFSGTTGALIKDSTATLSDAGALSTGSLVLATGLQLSSGAVDGTILRSDASGNATWQVRNKIIVFRGTVVNYGSGTPNFVDWGANANPESAVIFRMPFNCVLNAFAIAYVFNLPATIDPGVIVTFDVGTIDAGDAPTNANFNPIAASNITFTDADNLTYPSKQLTGLSSAFAAGDGVCVRVNSTGSAGPSQSDVVVTVWFTLSV